MTIQKLRKIKINSTSEMQFNTAQQQQKKRSLIKIESLHSMCVHTY